MRFLYFLKKYFIPNEENNHEPHILRHKTIVVLCLIILITEGIFVISFKFVTPRSNLFANIIENALVFQTNEERANINKSELKINLLLQQAAQEKALDMAENNYFAHTSPAGTTPWDWLKKVGYEFDSAGENLAVNFNDSQDVINAWMESSSHKENILNEKFTEIGIATALGEFKDKSAIYVVQFFGKPPQKKVTSPVIAASPKLKPLIENTIPKEKQKEIVLSQEVKQTAKPPNVIQLAAIQPKTFSNIFYFIIIAIFSLAIILNVFIKKHIQNRNLILGGFTIIAISFICFLVNQYLIFLPTTVI